MFTKSTDALGSFLHHKCNLRELPFEFDLEEACGIVHATTFGV